MKLIYTNENRFIVNNIKNIIENTGIEITLKNEYIAGAAGDLSPFDTWLEIWVENEDYNKAMQIVDDIDNADNSHDWFCSNCHEKNNASFELCWQCQSERP
ncbi:MAG: hypothetical protein DIZ80_16975 [endosymbiont of Galathealinum brachiosum]|uniref:RanBP2-type domain-containing protein n=1 Tax=endosymbiont of Galathealinum brachiosum TaxID=2200906 RepID=A0A370D7X0_9GAMM|nr:MAG: hypothetical protein DIZ80_16975 [endosymbiont of Galathealinum brachiosum]